MSAFAEQQAVSWARRLDERQRAILRALYDHEVLLTRQLEILFFSSTRSCQRALKELADLQLIERDEVCEQVGDGRQQPQWTLQELGVQVVAVTMRKARSQLDWMPRSTWHNPDKYLEHLLRINRFFVSLVAASRQFVDQGVEKWVKDHYVRTAKSWIRPDGFGRYQHREGACDFYLEYDRATEWNAQLVKKLRGYILMAMHWTEEGKQHFPNLLVVVPEPKREAAFDKALRDSLSSLEISIKEAVELPLFVTSETLLEEEGMLGQVWRRFVPAPPQRPLAGPLLAQRISFLELPCYKNGPYDLDRCLGRRWTEQGKSAQRHRPRPPTYPTGRPPDYLIEPGEAADEGEQDYRGEGGGLE